MKFEELTVINPVQSTYMKEGDKNGGTPRRYFKIELKTEDFKVPVYIWEHHEQVLFDKILAVTGGLDWYDFPRIVLIPIHGILVRTSVPGYILIEPEDI